MFNDRIRRHSEIMSNGGGKYNSLIKKQNSGSLAGTQKSLNKSSETLHDKKVRDAKQHLGGAMDIILRILEETGVAAATINELRKDTRSQKYKEVLSRAQQYISCFKSNDSAYSLVLNGWETLSRLETLRFRQSLKILRKIKLGEKSGNIRKANKNLQSSAEECAASQLGLYKAQVWKSRMEKIG